MPTYEVVEAAVLVRGGFDMKSKPAGQLKAGEEIEGLESKVNEKGATRVRFEGPRLNGWVSLTAGDGMVLLKESAGSRAATPPTPPKRKKAAPPPKAKAAGPAPSESYKVAEKTGARVRAGFAMDSTPAGALKFGDVIEVLESKVNDKGTTRLKFAKGWVSVTAGDGSVLLEKVAAAAKKGSWWGGGEKEPAAAKPKAAAKPAAAAKYSVVEKAGVLVRGGFDMKSKPQGQLKHGEVVESLESKVNEKGTTRIRFKGRLAGWVSLKAGNGDTLLEAVAGDEGEYEEEEEEEKEPEPGKCKRPPAQLDFQGCL